MTMPLRRQFSELELDALTELVNISVSAAATSLSRIVRQEVLLSVPALSIATPEQAVGVLGGDSSAEITGVRQHFDGDLSGDAILLFPEEASLQLAELVLAGMGETPEEPALLDDALREAGNIVLQGCLSAIANLLRRSFRIAAPEVVHIRPGQLAAGPDDAILLIYMTFNVRGRLIRGYVALLLDLPSLSHLRDMVAEYMTSVGAGEG